MFISLSTIKRHYKGEAGIKFVLLQISPLFCNFLKPSNNNATVISTDVIIKKSVHREVLTFIVMKRGFQYSVI
jgi:hypothetical protein